MPAASTSLDEEVWSPPSRLVAGGELRDGFLKELLAMRRPGERLGDLRQMGAGASPRRR
jgi:hypothetical protein